MIETISYEGFERCVRIGNGAAEVVVTTGFGPRIVHYSIAGGQNVLGLHPDAKVETGLGTWRPYGGHRLWIAPENMPLSYAPDNVSVTYDIENDLTVRFIQPVEENSGTQKEMTVRMAFDGTAVTVDHRITNLGPAPIVVSAWALTIMREGGEAVIPNEPFEPYGPNSLLPVRNLTMWSYTDLTDPRWTFTKDTIRLRTDTSRNDAQKIGVLNKQGWLAYRLGDLEFTKRFDHVPHAAYPDMNSNVEVYTAGGFIELETLSPLRSIGTGESIDHTEHWLLRKAA